VLGDEVKALVVGGFGTVVDWRGSVVREGEELARARGSVTPLEAHYG
jgi:2-haloacid dehalogenase